MSLERCGRRAIAEARETVGGLDRQRRTPKQTRLFGLGPDKSERDAMLLPFGEKLRSLRASAGFSQEALARRCFLRGTDISALERGHSSPTLPALLMLREALGVSVGSLTDSLAAPTRQAGRAQTLTLLTAHPSIGMQALAESMEVPLWYVRQLVRYLEANGAIAWQPADGQSRPRRIRP
jgi:transcriptional regulator with XRE-family HTH domain